MFDPDTPNDPLRIGDTGAANCLNACRSPHLLLGKSADAAECFERAFALPPGNPVILNKLGNALFNLKRLDEARDATFAHLYQAHTVCILLHLAVSFGRGFVLCNHRVELELFCKSGRSFATVVEFLAGMILALLEM